MKSEPTTPNNSIPSNNDRELFLQYLHEYHQQFKNVDQLMKILPKTQQWRFYFDGINQTDNASVIVDFEGREKGYFNKTKTAFSEMLKIAKIQPPRLINSTLYKKFHTEAMHGLSTDIIYGDRRDTLIGNYNSGNSSIVKSSQIGINRERKDKDTYSGWTKQGLYEVIKKICEGDVEPHLELRSLSEPIKNIELNTKTVISLYQEKTPEEITDQIWLDNSIQQIRLTHLVPGDMPEQCILIRERNMENLFSQFNKKCLEENDPFQKLNNIVALVRECDQRHPFADGNTRTACFLLLNYLLVQNNFPPVILNNPNAFDTFSQEQLVHEVIIGIYNTFALASRYQPIPQLHQPLPFDDIFSKEMSSKKMDDVKHIVESFAPLSPPSFLECHDTLFNHSVDIFKSWDIYAKKNPHLHDFTTFFNAAVTNKQYALADHIKNLHKIDVNRPLKNTDWPLLEYAASENDEKMVEYLLENKANINFVSEGKNTLLTIAVEKYNQKMLALLIKNKADLNMKNGINKSILHTAIGNRNFKALELLIQSKVNQFNTTDKWGYTPLERTIIEKNPNYLKYLADQKANLNERLEIKSSLLYWMCNCSDPKYLKLKNLLIIRNNGGIPQFIPEFNLLHRAAFDGDVPTLKMLLDLGAELKQTNHGISPREIAYISRNNDIAELLFKKECQEEKNPSRRAALEKTNNPDVYADFMALDTSVRTLLDISEKSTVSDQKLKEMLKPMQSKADKAWETFASAKDASERKKVITDFHNEMKTIKDQAHKIYTGSFILFFKSKSDLEIKIEDALKRLTP